MTELEKARNNLRSDIDFNKLVEELRASYEDNERIMCERKKDGFESFMDLPKHVVMAPAVNTLVVFNSVLGAARITNRNQIMIIAAVGVLKDVLLTACGDDERNMVEIAQRLLANGVSTIHTRIPVPPKDEDS